MTEIRIKLLQPWRCFDKGRIVSVSGGVADLLVNRKRPPIAEYVEPTAHGQTSLVHTLVPAVPGLHQIVQSVTGKKRKTNG